MERRALLKGLALLGVGTIPFANSWSRAVGRKMITAPTRPYHKFKLGDLSLTIITDGYIRLAPIQPNFPNGSERAEHALLEQSFRSTKAMDLSMNILLIQKGKEFILIDTGTGGSFGEASGWMLQSMADAGIQKEAVTQIIISHAHPDHIGGLVKDGQLVFPNAQVHLSRIEHAFWMAAEQDFSKSKFQDKKLLKTFTQNTQQVIRTLGNRLHLFENGTQLWDCVQLEIAPGHTPGHTITHIFSANERIVHLADLIHSDILSVQHPEWGFNGDTDLELATRTRRAVLAKLTASKTPIFAYHLPWPGTGHVRSKGTTFEWVPEVFAYPVS
ncbi:glyoxylase-like metal-dependent hydrolase (beta-lactamase superfamily II) [Chitinophaga skermanii]|uniref:Glyoxylase-like metal-dependent hydrolase (Beta-lactamase superfamily II) n=1 Tax=Chitinophaga skermanii TaxID=331697 RepID=A0A327QYK1_9BACT|nr:MBL fold metallo-hydrolase [Chitinophaga skermanii]RAJ08794.1 glyoxylase-like metal-dependent hydrolase (beta-lactamase superfamily II) [Chitinophaga skermanii]